MYTIFVNGIFLLKVCSPDNLKTVRFHLTALKESDGFLV